MKKALILLFSLSSGLAVMAQSGPPNVFTKTKKVEVKDPITTYEIFASVEVEKKLVEDAWKIQLSRYGRMMTSRGNMMVDPAFIPSISTEPLIINSHVSTSRGWTTVFMTILLANGETISASHPKYGAAEKILSSFLEKTQRLADVGMAEQELNSSDKQVQGDQGLSMQMQKDLDANRKEYNETKRKLEALEIEFKEIKEAMAKHEETKKKTMSSREDLRKKVLEYRQKMQAQE